MMCLDNTNDEMPQDKPQPAHDQIDIISVCVPVWCIVGFRQLEQALAQQVPVHISALASV
jgi:hypothetical protein